MPSYDYHCRECHTWEEVSRSIHDIEEAVSCPKCGSDMSRVYGPVGVVLKGDGFYRNTKNKQAKNFYPESGDSL